MSNNADSVPFACARLKPRLIRVSDVLLVHRALNLCGVPADYESELGA